MLEWELVPQSDGTQDRGNCTNIYTKTVTRSMNKIEVKMDRDSGQTYDLQAYTRMLLNPRHHGQPVVSLLLHSGTRTLLAQRPTQSPFNISTTNATSVPTVISCSRVSSLARYSSHPVVTL